MARLVVYTVLVGKKEVLNNPIQYLSADQRTDLPMDFVCFTDDPDLTSPVWAFRPMPDRLMPPDRLSRLPKAMPHRFFPDHEYSLYIDNTVVFKRLPTQADLGRAEGSVFRAFRHPWRQCPQDEADVVVRSSLDEPETVADQVLFYINRGLPLAEVRPLTAGTVLLRRHHDERVRAFGEMWWEQILVFSRRDQISIDLCARRAGCPIDHYPGDKRDNDLFLWPAYAGPRRADGTFDAERHAWENRRDPAARADPVAHYLANGSATKPERPVAWFRYCCDRAGSGLGRRFAPRRGLADILDPVLRAIVEHPSEGGQIDGFLLVGVESADAHACDPSELEGAKAAIALFFRFATQPAILTTMVPDAELDDPAPYRSAHGLNGFRLVIVIGATPARHRHALAKFLPLLRSDGRILIQFGGELSIEDMARMRAEAPQVRTLSVHHGQHISHPDPIPGSVFLAGFALDSTPSLS